MAGNRYNTENKLIKGSKKKSSSSTSSSVAATRHKHTSSEAKYKSFTEGSDATDITSPEGSVDHAHAAPSTGEEDTGPKVMSVEYTQVDNSQNAQDGFQTQSTFDDKELQARNALPTMLPQEHQEWQTYEFTQRPRMAGQYSSGDWNVTNMLSPAVALPPPSDSYSTTQAPHTSQPETIDDYFSYPSDPYGTVLVQPSVCSSTAFEFADSPPAEYPEDNRQLQQWAYETYNPNLTVAERFEKSNWERERREKL